VAAGLGDRALVRAALAVVLVALCAGCGSGKAVRVPTITEGFTPLACPKTPVSTVDLEGCDEQAITRGDRAIAAKEKAIVAALRTRDARRSFVGGEQAWLRYRGSSCTAEASKFDGGTLVPVAYAGCVVGRNNAHVRELASTLDVLTTQ
jgi:uncharacterized protein YecT (DUF1311 family)